MPFHVNDHRAGSMGDRTLDELMPLAHDPNSNLAEIVPAVGVRAHAGPGIDRFAKNADTKSIPGGKWKPPRCRWALISAFCFGTKCYPGEIDQSAAIPPEQRVGGSGVQTRLLFQTAIVNARHARASALGSHHGLNKST
jgi:hypothetical protein